MLRRLHALWWAFAPLIDTAQVKRDGAEFKRLAGVAAGTRDWDVLRKLLLADENTRAFTDGLIPAITEQRLNALSSSRATIKSADIEAVMRTAFVGTLRQLESRGDDPIVEFARSRVKVAEKRMKARIKNALRRQHTDFETLQEVRIAGQKLRYLREFFAPVLKGRPNKGIKRLSTFQKKLESLNDLVVTEVLVRSSLSLGAKESDLEQTLQWIG